MVRKVYKKLRIKDWMKRDDMILATANFYKDKNTIVHITLASGQWYNGKIISVGRDRLVIDEKKFGKLIVMFERIVDDGIIPYAKKDGR